MQLILEQSFIRADLSEIFPLKSKKTHSQAAWPLRGLANPMATYSNSPDEFGAEKDVLGQNLHDCDLQTSLFSECVYCQPFKAGMPRF